MLVPEGRQRRGEASGGRWGAGAPGCALRVACAAVAHGRGVLQGDAAGGRGGQPLRGHPSLPERHGSTGLQERLQGVSSRVPCAGRGVCWGLGSPEEDPVVAGSPRLPFPLRRDSSAQWRRGAGLGGVVAWGD